MDREDKTIKEDKLKTGILMVKGSNKPITKRVKFCEVPDCNGYSISDIITICRKHYDLLKFVMWAMNTIKISDENRTKSGLILPK